MVKTSKGSVKEAAKIFPLLDQVAGSFVGPFFGGQPVGLVDGLLQKPPFVVASEENLAVVPGLADLRVKMQPRSLMVGMSWVSGYLATHLCESSGVCGLLTYVTRRSSSVKHRRQP